MERINVKTKGGTLIDLEQRSEVVAARHDFKLARAYVDREYLEVEREVHKIVDKEVRYVSSEA